MSTLSTALAAQRLSVDDPAWTLLRAQHARPAVAILGEHLGGEDKRLPAPVLFSKVEEDLAVLRDHGFDLPQTAQQYCAGWRESGFLIRRSAEASREEVFELSAALGHGCRAGPLLPRPASGYSQPIPSPSRSRCRAYPGWPT